MSLGCRWVVGLFAAAAVWGGAAPAVQEAATPEPSLQRYGFKSAHMGTLFEMSLYATNQAAAEWAAEKAFRRITELDGRLSDYQADSELNSLRDQPVGVPRRVSGDLFDVLLRARRFSELSQGVFDVTVGPYVRLWRFSRKRKALPAAVELAEARASVGWRNLQLDARHQTVTLLAPGMRLDVGGIAKGYASDQALMVLRALGIKRALVAASGDIAVSEPPPGQEGWRVTVSGLNSGVTAPVLLLRNAAISTSGDTEQFVEIEGVRYSHIVSPLTGLGLTHRIQASVVGSDATSTDALATTVCILGAERGLKLVNSLPNTGAMVITRESGGPRVTTTRVFRDRVLSEDTTTNERE